MTQNPNQISGDTQMNRRHLLFLGGLTAVAAVDAACSSRATPKTSPTGEGNGQTSGTSSAREATPAQETERGDVWHLSWRQVANQDLADEVHREGEDFEGDRSSHVTTDPKTWKEAAIVGVPKEEIEDKGETELGIAVIRGDVLEYAKFDKMVPLVWVGGKQYHVVRVPLGPEDATIGFVSGGVDETPLADGPSWAAESTRVVGQSTMTDSDYFNMPLVS